jgi:hypothetical protein
MRTQDRFSIRAKHPGDTFRLDPSWNLKFSTHVGSYLRLSN